MFTSIPAADALAGHPVEAAALVAKLASGKSKHAGTPGPLLEWGYEWCVAIGMPSPFGPYVPKGSPIPKGIDGICLAARIGAWKGREPIPVGPAPQAVHDAYVAMKAPKPPPAGSTPIVVRHQNGRTLVEHVVGGYEKGSGSKRRIYLVHGEAMLLLVAGSKAFIAGYLRPAAVAAFHACAPGGTFRYRNAPFRRLTDVEAAALASAHNPYEGGIAF